MDAKGKKSKNRRRPSFCRKKYLRPAMCLSGCSGRSSCGKVLFYIVIERRREVRAVSHAERQHANLLQMALLAIGKATSVHLCTPAVFWLGYQNWCGHLGASLDRDFASPGLLGVRWDGPAGGTTFRDPVAEPRPGSRSRAYVSGPSAGGWPKVALMI